MAMASSVLKDVDQKDYWRLCAYALSSHGGWEHNAFDLVGIVMLH